MSSLAPFNLQNWVAENRHLLKPPVGNKAIWCDGKFMVMVVGGPNARTDYHINPGEELFYQIEGDVVIKIIEDGKPRDIPLKQGDIFLLPANVPHSPQRPANTVGLVVEHPKCFAEQHHLRWYCRGCGDVVHDAIFQPADIGAQIKAMLGEFNTNESIRKCKGCGQVFAVEPMKIDLHTHILPKNWPSLRERYGYGGFVQLEHHGPGCARMVIDGTSFREIEANCWDPEVRIAECARHAVDVQVLSTVPVMFSYWAKPRDTLDLSRLLNDHIAELARVNPKRFVGLGTLPLQEPDLAVPELERCVRELGLSGVQIGTHVNGMNLDDPRLFPIFAAAEKLGAAVFVHPWDMLAKERMEKYWLRWLVGMPAETCLAICSVLFGGVLERLPKLRIAFAHGGGAFSGTIGRIDHGFHSRPDLCAIDTKTAPRSHLGRFYLDSLVHDPEALRTLIRQVGPERIALGTDYPFPLGETEPGRLIESLPELSAEARERMMAGTALEFLGRRFEDFT